VFICWIVMKYFSMGICCLSFVNFSLIFKLSLIETLSANRSVRSSMYIVNFMSLPSLPGGVIPLIILFSLIAHANGSIAIINNSGDSGQPCLTPALIAKGRVMVPFTTATLLHSLYKVLIHLLNVSPKLR
uniref:Uncharacterized protein n=1 Tax=Xiphophorus maculatus TaxID=8083 RepID=A0A3B5Q1N0_XIPMA